MRRIVLSEVVAGDAFAPTAALSASDVATAVVVCAVRLFAATGNFLFFQIRKIDFLKIVERFPDVQQAVRERSVTSFAVCACQSLA